ncbi:hypothetical protein CUR178_02484 [Leishmania enriettii]|uniref:DOP1 N-terminal domain-containing protein n=1 Tax=Leishmania enriettii TaxID=5663 RepID=A0A836KMH1_LEIEN|nr:hypothetical protein CUR178_02484 [Leishmania enriettii]
MSDVFDNGEGQGANSSQPPALTRSPPPPIGPPAVSIASITSVASAGCNGVYSSAQGSAREVASHKAAQAPRAAADTLPEDAHVRTAEADAIVDDRHPGAVAEFSLFSHHIRASQDPSLGQQSHALAADLPLTRYTSAGAACDEPAATQPTLQDVGPSARVSTSDIANWQKGREYQMLKRDMRRLLSAMDSTPSTDWAAQASLLGQLLVCLKQHRGVIAAVELPDGLHFAKALSRTLSPLSVVGVQRKALEVVQCYLDYANPVYPMTKDLPFVLPGLLELLPQASMQVKGDVLDLIDRGVVRRLPGSALRACVQGLLTVLLNCLEESETSPIYRRAMALLEYVQTTLAHHAPAPSSSSASQHGGWAELRGGQVLAAHTWVLIRDASALRAPALNFMKVFIAQGGGLASGAAADSAEGTAEGGSESPVAALTAASALPDWVGGDAATMAFALLNCLQDTQEKTHRLALDVLLTVCPMTSVDRDYTTAAHNTPAALSDGTASMPNTCPAGVPTLASCGSGAIVPFEVKALLVAAAVQLLGTRYGTPSVARRIFQWLTVDPAASERPGTGGETSLSVCGGGYHSDALSPSATSSSVAYVPDIACHLISHGFSMAVDHWHARWVGEEDDGVPVQQSAAYLPAALSALEHTAAQAIRTATAPRLSSASSVSAALGGGEANGNCVALPNVLESVQVASVWLRALLVLFRYQSRSTQESAGAPLMSPVARSPSAYADSEESDATDCAPFLVHLAPLLIPSLSRLIAGVRSVAGRVSGGDLGGAVSEMWTAGLQELLRVLPWFFFVERDTIVLQAVEELLQPALRPSAPGVEEGDEPTYPAASPASAHAQAATFARAQKRIAAQTDNLYKAVQALEGVLVSATAEHPSPAQEYVRASLQWSERVAQLLREVLNALEAQIRSAGTGAGDAAAPPLPLASQGPLVALLLSTAGGLLRLLKQRMQQLMEPMLNSVLATASATGTPSVVTVDFFLSFLTAVDACVLRHIRDATVALTAAALWTPRGGNSGDRQGTEDGVPAATAALFSFPEHAPELQRLLARMHRTTLSFTSFVVELRLRCQRQACFGIVLDSACETGAGSREPDLSKQTAVWLESLCSGTTVAAATGVHLFFSRAVRLLLDALLRARGCLLPEMVYGMLEPPFPVAGGIAEGVAFTEAYILSPVVHCIWEGCGGDDEVIGAAPHTFSSDAVPATGRYTDVAEMRKASLLALIAVSPACSRCLDTFLLETPVDVAVPRLVGLQWELMELRTGQRRWQSLSTAAPALTTQAELREPGVLFLGYLMILDCLLYASSGIVVHGGLMAESTRQLARAYISHASVWDLASLLLPLYFSFLCPLVAEPACTSSASGELRCRGTAVDAAPAAASSLAHSAGCQALSTVPLTVLLPTVTAARTTDATGPTPLARSRWFKDARGTLTDARRGATSRGYRCIEAAELVRYLFALLQLPTAVEWVRKSMETPTPNSLRVLLRALEAQSFVPSDEVVDTSSSLSPASPASAPAREGATETLFSATALLLLSLARHALLSLHAAHMRRQDTLRSRPCLRCLGANHLSASLSAQESTAALQWRCSALLDAMGCLNRLLEVSQTGPRMRPHRTAVSTWQFTAAQLLPLLRLSVQANLHSAQAVLLDHIRYAVLYLDDVGGVQALCKSPLHQPETMSGAFASRHWLPHPFLEPGGASDKADSCTTGSSASTGHVASAATEATVPTYSSAVAAPAFVLLQSRSGTAVLDELKRAPPAVLSNKLLYAMMGEVVERVLCCHDASARPGSEDNPAHASSSQSRPEEDTLALWLRFYSDIMPYLYRDLVASAEMVVDVLLSALEASAGAYAGDGAVLAARSLTTSAPAQALCYAALVDIAQFLCELSRVYDAENYVLAVRKKESMSWIASTFTQEDPVAQAQSATLWDRSPVLSPIRGALPRLVAASTRCIRACDSAAFEPGNTMRGAMHALWADYTEAGERVGWRATAAEPLAQLREQARRLLCLLKRAAGPRFLMTFVRDWCDQYAVSSAWWMFEDKQQRERRVGTQAMRDIGKERVPDVVALREDGGGTGALSSSEEEWVAASRMKHEAQRAACVLLVDVEVSISELTAVATPLVRTAAEKGPRTGRAQPQQPSSSTGRSGGEAAPSELAPPALHHSPAAEVLFFLDQVVEGHCAERRSGMAEADAEALLAALAEMVSQRSPDTLAFCCLFHLLYCVVAYAKDKEDEGRAPRSGGRGRRRRQSGVSASAAVVSVTVSGVYGNSNFSFALCRLLEGFHAHPTPGQCSSALLSMQLLCQTLRSVLPSPLAMVDNAGRVVDAATHMLQRALFPLLRRGIASASEAEIVLCAPLVCASLRVLRALVAGFAPDLTFQRRAQRDILSLVFSEHFFRYSRSALHEWALLLRQWSSLDQGFHSLMCERMVPSPGRLSAMLMSREAEALLWQRSLWTMGFYTYSVHVSEPSLAVVGSATITGGSAGASGAALTVSSARRAELVHLLREHLAYAFQHFSSSTIPTVAQLQHKELFLQPLRAALLAFRVVLLCNLRESLVASLWPIVLPELCRILSTPLTGSGPDAGKSVLSSSQPSPAEWTALGEIAATQIEALKVLDTDYTLYPAHALAFRWLFTDDAALASLAVLQGRQTASVKGGMPTADTVTRHPAVSHLEVLHLLQTSSPSVAKHLDAAEVVNTVHEPRAATGVPHCDSWLAAPLSSLPRTWPASPRPSAADTGLRRPLYNIPSSHYQRLDGVYRAAQAFTLLLQRLNTHAAGTFEAAQPVQQYEATLASLCAAVSAAVGMHNEVDTAYMCDLLEADMTSTDPDTML